MGRLNGGSATNASGGSGGGTQYAVDTAALGTDIGTLALVVRDDILSTLTPIDGDYAQLRVSSVGSLWTKIDTSGGSIDVIPSDQLDWGIQNEDGPHSSGDKGVPAWGVRNDTASTAFTNANGDYNPIAVDSHGRLFVTGDASMVAIKTDGSAVAQPVTINAGANVIGHVIVDTSSTTAVTQATGTNLHMVVDSGTVTTVSNISQIASTTPTFGDVNNSATETGTLDVAPIGRYNATQPTLTDTRYNQLQISSRGELLVSPGVSNFAVQATPITQADTFMLGGVNIKEINAVTPLMGNGTTGTGSLRVTVASDNTAFAVNATLSAETTKVLGVTRTADGAGNLLTSNSTTYTAKFGLDANLLGTLGTAFSTAGKVDIKVSSGDVASGAFASGSIASGAIASGAVASGAFASGSIASGAIVAGAIAAGATSFVKLEDVASADADAGVPAMAILKATAADTAGTDGDYQMLQMKNGRLWSEAGYATGAAVPANTIYNGGLAKTALPTAATDGNLTGIMLDKFGRQIVLPQAPRDLISSQTTIISNSASETTIITAGAAGVFNDLLSLVFINTSATATRVDLKDATSGTIIGAFFLPAGDTRGVSWSVPLPQTTAANNWTITCGTAVIDIRVLAQFVKNK